MDSFHVNVPDEVLDDLRARLKRTRWVKDFANDGWQYGTNMDYLKELVAYWIDGYDWRKHEQAINLLPQFRTEIDGVPVHFVYVRGKGPDPKALILSHGWPWTFWEYRKVIDPLSDPGSHSGDPVILLMPSTWWSPRCQGTASRRRTASPASTSGALQHCG